ncbi:5'-nucleotidase SurE [Pseudovibrio axinellae]|uniref:5'-nucleotidase SurE n=1 Tax=Pseudovibrio axinellae TaxID=989403 RepID=A0A165YQN8_9HYPH|nr:5'/3'-nucleotidase SurE [Pseudovibrio axinellae]KZL19130.1 5'-nucleotidase SurE [Pseudovibrio axinellae]SER34250.1 5'-nucleotidase /3'-nucleotidase /exopolyphosphatase [Pseudovibrio axinellae]
MRILLTNDDGIHAEGLEVLERIARQISDDVWVVAPESDQSGVAHSLSLNDPLRVRQIDNRHFAVRGTPTDCVIMAVRSIMDSPPDLVLSGINRGANIADDVTYSGTVAAAMEGALMGVRSIALSQAYAFGSEAGPSYDTSEAHAVGVLRSLMEFDLPADTLLNVNFPKDRPENVKGVKVVRQGKRDAGSLYIESRRDGRGNPYHWLAFNNGVPSVREGTDIEALKEGYISVTPLHLNLTADELMGQLEKKFENS